LLDWILNVRAPPPAPLVPPPPRTRLSPSQTRLYEGYAGEGKTKKVWWGYAPIGTPVQGLEAGLMDPFEQIEKTIDAVDTSGLLTKVAKTGLLSKLDRAGVKLADVEPLLVFAEEQGLLGALGDLNDELLPILPTLIALAGPATPLLGVLINVPSPAYFALALASLGGAVVVTGQPDDSVASVALQTFLAVPLGTLFPVLFGGLGVAASKLAPGALA
jgi:hypothetical protein